MLQTHTEDRVTEGDGKRHFSPPGTKQHSTKDFLLSLTQPLQQDKTLERRQDRVTSWGMGMRGLKVLKGERSTIACHGLCWCISSKCDHTPQQHWQQWGSVTGQAQGKLASTQGFSFIHFKPLGISLLLLSHLLFASQAQSCFLASDPSRLYGKCCTVMGGKRGGEKPLHLPNVWWCCIKFKADNAEITCTSVSMLFQLIGPVNVPQFPVDSKKQKTWHSAHNCIAIVESCAWRGKRETIMIAEAERVMLGSSSRKA